MNTEYIKSLKMKLRKAVRRLYQMKTPVKSVWPVAMVMPEGRKNFWWIAEVDESQAQTIISYKFSIDDHQLIEYTMRSTCYLIWIAHRELLPANERPKQALAIFRRELPYLADEYDSGLAVALAMWSRVVLQRTSYHFNHNKDLMDWQSKILRLAVDAWEDHVGVADSKAFITFP